MGHLRHLIGSATLLSAIAASPHASSIILKDKDLSVTDAIKLCAQFEDDRERLLCFEALAKSVDAKAGADSAAKPAARPQTERSPPPNTNPDVADPSPPTTSDPSPRLRSTVERDDDQAEPTFEFTRTDSKKRKKRDREPFENAVYKSWRNGRGELRVAFKDGEIWRQVGNETVLEDPKRDEIAKFKPGLVGSWTVKFTSARKPLKMTQIRRK